MLDWFQTAFDDNRNPLIHLFAQFDNFRAVFVGFFLIHAVDFRQLRQILRPSGGNGAQGNFAAYLISFEAFMAGSIDVPLKQAAHQAAFAFVLFAQAV